MRERRVDDPEVRHIKDQFARRHAQTVIALSQQAVIGRAVEREDKLQVCVIVSDAGQHRLAVLGRQQSRGVKTPNIRDGGQPNVF